MTLTYMKGDAVEYRCLSTDFTAGSTVVGASYKGAHVYVEDTQKWYIISDDLTLKPLVYITASSSGSSGGTSSSSVLVTNFPVNQTVSGSVNILSGSMTITSGSININNFPSVQTVTGSLIAGEAFIGHTGGQVVPISGSFARASGSVVYSIGDEICNSTTASSVVLIEFQNAARVNGGSGYVVGVKITTNVKSLTPSIRLHLYNASNPTVAGDNNLHVEKYADLAKRLGYMDMPAMTTAADTANSDMSRTTDFGGQTNGIHAIAATAGTRSIYGLLETLTAFTPTTLQEFTVTLLIDQN